MYYLMLFVSLFWYTTYLQAVTCLQEKLSHAQAGDFVVTTQEGHHSLLSIRSLHSPILVLEEVSVPLQHIDLKHICWKEWIQQKAPGHTSWTLYEIDLSSGELIECFSVSKNGWLLLDRSEQILTRLMTLTLFPVPDSERKKIGSLSPGELDHRRLWNPPLIKEGKQLAKAEFDVVKGRWPADRSLLANSEVDLYFAREFPDFPFPFWIEIKSAHYVFKLRTIDSGQGLLSPAPSSVPHRPSQTVGPG